MAERDYLIPIRFVFADVTSRMTRAPGEHRRERRAHFRAQTGERPTVLHALDHAVGREFGERLRQGALAHAFDRAQQ